MASDAGVKAIKGLLSSKKEGVFLRQYEGSGNMIWLPHTHLLFVCAERAFV